MTQRLQAEHVIDGMTLPTEEQVRQLNEVLELSQNRPPLGKADGSIDPETWVYLGQLVEALEATLRSVRDFRKLR